MKITQTGRSMVEMLGVLAIIGVLSVGGIAGYSKAMFKHKINKTIQDITTISQGIRTLCFDGANKCNEYPCFSGSIKTGCSLLKNLNLVPEYMWDGETNNLINPFGGKMDISFSSTYMYIEYYGIPQNVCTALATVDWITATSGVSEIRFGYGSPTSVYSKEYAKKNNITLTRENSLPIPIDVVSKVCNENDNNRFQILFHP